MISDVSAQNAPKGYVLSIEIVSSIIQAMPEDAIKSWSDIKVVDGKLEAK